LKQITIEEQQQHEEDLGIDKRYQIPDELWKRIQVLIPPPPPRKNKDRPGRPRMDNWKAMNAIYYIARTGCQWKALPRSLGAPSTVHDRFQEWREAYVFENMWKEGLLEYDAMKGIEWEWQAIDGALTKAPLGGKKHGTKSDRPIEIWHKKRTTC
jgi:putative transposase